MDCNSIVYDSVHLLEKHQDRTNYNINNFEDSLIELVIEKINNYIFMINPLTTIFIAFDGVAPFAKMDQQRKRRYKTHFLSKINFSKTDPVSRWNTSSITPGTEFMNKLNIRLGIEFKNSEKKYNVQKVIFSGSDEPGEGEHKLFYNLRNNDFKNDNFAVYGLDSDLIMLSIFHIKFCNNIYIFREAPAFLKSSIPIDNTGNENDPHFLDIKLLSSSISFEMNCKFSDLHRTVDYIFMCFFLGNDFLPHFPAMNIRTHGIQALLDIYRMYIGNSPDRFLISKNNNINWKNVRILLKEVSKREHEFLLNEYFVRNKMERRPYCENTPDEKGDFLNNIPIIFRGEEKYICPDESYWEDRYYKALFNENRNYETLKNICNNYLQGLEWVFKYYTFDCPDWRWKYNYHYPPLFLDLEKFIPDNNFEYFGGNNKIGFSSYSQLAYVLPVSNLEFLPDNISNYLRNNHSELYPENYDFKWAFCRYFWEAHPILPNISVEMLENIEGFSN